MKTITTQRYPKELKKLKDHIDGGILEVLTDVGAYVAGGAVTSMFTNKEVNDIDVYFPSKEAFTIAMQNIFKNGEGDPDLLCEDYGLGDFEGVVTIVTKKAVLLTVSGNKVQFVVHRFYESAAEIFKDFDFSVCMGALDLKNEQWVFHEDFLKHCSQRHIHFNPGTAYPIISALRVHKYKEKGYNIPKAQFLKIMLAVNAKEINTWDKLIEELSGMYGSQPEEIFDLTKPFNLLEAIESLDNIEIKDYMNTQSFRGLSDIIKIIPDAFTEEFKLRVEEKKKQLEADRAAYKARYGLNW